jgi:hypothetical protein
MLMLLTTGAASSMSDSGQHHRDCDVQHGADDERRDDAYGNIALWVLSFFRRGGNRVKSNVGEENDGAAGEHARPAFRHEGMIVRGMNEAQSYKYEG